MQRSKIEHLRDKIAEHREHRQGSNPGSLQALQTEVTSLKTDLAGMANNEALLLSQLNAANTLLSSLAARLKVIETGGGGTSPALAELAKYVKVDPNPINGLKGPHVIFHDANVHVPERVGHYR